MHDDKIWTLDLHEKIEQEEGEETSLKSTIFMITGGCDSSVKVWRDYTIEQEIEDKSAILQRIKDEQTLSHLLREKDYVEAAVIAFRLNRLRDFYHVLNRVLVRS
jgi:hypothetical protein